jgi:hypothetical protein
MVFDTDGIILLRHNGCDVIMIFAPWRNQFEEEVEVVVFDVGVDEFLAVPIHDADIHLAGVQVDSAVELCGGGVILHGDRSLWGRETLV